MHERKIIVNGIGAGSPARSASIVNRGWREVAGRPECLWKGIQEQAVAWRTGQQNN